MTKRELQVEVERLRAENAKLVEALAAKTTTYVFPQWTAPATVNPYPWSAYPHVTWCGEVQLPANGTVCNPNVTFEVKS